MKKIIIFIYLMIILVILPYISYTQESHLSFILNEIGVLSLAIPYFKNHSEWFYKVTQQMKFTVFNPTFFLQANCKLSFKGTETEIFQGLKELLEQKCNLKIIKCERIIFGKYKFETQNDLKGNDIINIDVDYTNEYVYLDFGKSTIGYRDTRDRIEQIVSIITTIEKKFNTEELSLGARIQFKKNNPYLGMYLNLNDECNTSITNVNVTIRELTATDVVITQNSIRVNSLKPIEFERVMKSYLLFKRV